MKSKSVLFLGCGDLGQRAGALLHQQGFSITGLRRNPAALPDFITPVVADYCKAEDLAMLGQLAPDYLVLSFVPNQRSTAGYRQGFTQAMNHALTGLAGHRPDHVIMVSSTRVYAERNGGWVAENAELATVDESAAAIVAAEEALLQSGLDGSVVRFGGIYGDPNGRMLRRIASGEICSAQPTRYSNRIHRDDCAGFLVHLINLAERGQAIAPCYTGVDDSPVPQYEVEQWLAAQLGVDAREQTSSVRAPGHKRCSNQALRDSGYELRYPDFRQGYAAVLR